MNDARLPLRDITVDRDEPETEQGAKPAVAASEPAVAESVAVPAMEPEPTPAPEPEPEPEPEKPTAIRNRRLGSKVTEENWRAWKMASIRYGVTQEDLANAAFDQCFQQGRLDPELIEKYKE